MTLKTEINRNKFEELYESLIKSGTINILSSEKPSSITDHLEGNEKMNMITKAKELLPSNYELIYLTEFGSVLYGTNKEGKSDIDLKGVFLPSLKDLVLNKASTHFRYSSGDSKSRNSTKDIDIELWSIHKFLKHFIEGDTGAIDLFFSMYSDKIIYSQEKIVKRILNEKEKMLSKNVKAFVGYCLGQASKYGIKGSKYGDLLEIYKYFKEYLDSDNTFIDRKINTLTQSIPDLKYVKIIKQKDKEYISVLGKMHETSLTLGQLLERLESQLNSYGDRTKESVKGVDWKALSHAYRVIYQIEELLETKMIKYPLKDANKIKEIKYDSTEDNLKNLLEDISLKIDEVYKLVDKSNLPERIDNEIIENLIWKIYLNRVFMV